MEVARGQIWADVFGRQYQVEGIEPGLPYPHLVQPLDFSLGDTLYRNVNEEAGWKLVNDEPFEFSKKPLTGADLQREIKEASKIYDKLASFFDYLVSQESDGGQTDPVPEWPSGPPPAQEPDPVAGVEPATDAQIAEWEEQVSPCEEDARRFSALIARVRQEHAALVETNEWLRDAERDLSTMTNAYGQAIERAEKAEAALACVERVTDLERAVVQAARVHVASMGMFTGALYYAVRALRDAQEADQ